MPWIMPIESTGVRKVGVFDLGTFYNFLYDIFISMGYSVEESFYKFSESENGNEIVFLWNCSKDVDDYSKIQIMVNNLVLGQKKAEIKKGDLTIGADAGDMEIKFSAYIITDKKGEWEKSQVLKRLIPIFEYFYKRTRRVIEGRAVEELYSAANQIKEFLEIKDVRK